MSKYTHEELQAKAAEIAALVEEAKNKIRTAVDFADDAGLFFQFQIEEEMYPLSYFGGEPTENYQYEYIVDREGIPIDLDYNDYKNKFGGLDHNKIYRTFPGARIVTRGWSPSTLAC